MPQGPEARQFANQRSHKIRLGIGGDNLKCQRRHRVAGQDRDRLTEDFVIGGPAATKIIVIHRRQIVMHKRKGMNQFHRRRRSKRRRLFHRRAGFSPHAIFRR